VKTISFISQKGGVGKTTLAIHLAVAFASDGLNVAILDLDPQASAAEWKDFREEEMPGVIAIPSSRLPKVLKELEAGGLMSSSWILHRIAKVPLSTPPGLQI
jgi:chromosome partitioning protein